MSRPDQYRERQPLEIEKLLTADQRRTVSNGDFQEWRESIAGPDSKYDDLDRELDAHLQVDPYVSGTNNRRSDRELSRMLDLIDNLPISDSGKDGLL